MRSKTAYSRIVGLVLIASALIGCSNTAFEIISASTPLIDQTALSPSEPSIPATGLPLASVLTGYEFPDSIDPSKRYMFYLHGKIIEDQGLPAVSPDFGEYEYEAILKKLEGHGFVVISEQRPKNTDAAQYAGRVVEQIRLLLDAGVSPESITVVGASMGAGIATDVSSLLKNAGTNFVLLGFCSPDTVEELKQNHLRLYGNILAIRDSADGLAGPCEELFTLSEGKGIGRHDEIILHLGIGHGILYQPLDEWILPSIQWAEGQVGQQ